jgi:hypothetical protein
MLKLSFKSEGPIDVFDAILTNVNEQMANIKAQVDDLGPKTADKMKQIIRDHKVRPQADEETVLENAIECEFFDGGWGVGNIDTLNDKAPGWAAINFGSSHMVGRRVPMGQFAPGEPAPDQGSFREGRWKVGEGDGGQAGGGFKGAGKSRYSFVVKNPIPPMNYIDMTGFWLYGELNTLKFS